MCISKFCITGFGFSLLYNASYSVVPSYFKGRQKFLALGSTLLGSGIGAMVVPILLEKLIQEYGWRGALLIYAGIVLNFCVSSIISGPNKTGNADRTQMKEIERPMKVSDSYNHSNHVVRSSSFKEKGTDKRSLRHRLISIFTTRPFLLYGISIMMVFPPVISVTIFFIDFIEAKGIEKNHAVMLYVYLNVAALFGRIAATTMARMKRIPKLVIPLVFSLVGFFGLLLFPFTETVPECAAAGCLLGTCLGGMICTLSVTTMDLIAENDYPLAFGVVTTLLGIANAFAGPLSSMYSHFYINEIQSRCKLREKNAGIVYWLGRIL